MNQSPAHDTLDRCERIRRSTRSTVTRAELLDAVHAACLEISRAEAREIVEMTLEEISATLVRGECVMLRSFGLFAVRAKRQRVGRNPRTGVEAPINSRRVVTFKPSPVLSACVNGAVPDQKNSLNRGAGSAKRANADKVLEAPSAALAQATIISP
jgi:integration host factor subunit alpha